MGMHFKLGLYEHQSAGALQSVIDLVGRHPEIARPDSITRVVIRAYQPACGIIGDPAERDPSTRQSADHSMVYIVATLLRKALEKPGVTGNDELWKKLMLTPHDYSPDAIYHPVTRDLMQKIDFEHGG